MSQLHKFIRGCTKHPGASARLIDFVHAYRDTTGDYKTLRRDIVGQLADGGFTTASDGRVTWVVGLSLGAWQNVGGYLVPQYATR